MSLRAGTSPGHLSGRPTPPPGVPESDEPHAVLPTTLGAQPDGTEVLYVGAGCFWGVERLYWQAPGVVSTAVGYMGGMTQNPSYGEVCTGATGHAEIVRVVYDPRQTTADKMFRIFWENHDPTQGDRQGNDRGSQYRSVVLWTTEHQGAVAEATAEAMGKQLSDAGYGQITTQIRPAQEEFYLAEREHQQYLHRNPGGYCNHGPNGMTCPVGLVDLPAQTDIAPPEQAVSSRS